MTHGETWATFRHWSLLELQCSVVHGHGSYSKRMGDPAALKAGPVNLRHGELWQFELWPLDPEPRHMADRGAQHGNDHAAEHHGGIDRGHRHEQAQPADDLDRADDDPHRLPEAGRLEGIDHEVGAGELGGAGENVGRADDGMNPKEREPRHDNHPVCAKPLVGWGLCLVATMPRETRT